MEQQIIFTFAILIAILSQADSYIKCEDSYVNLGYQCLYLSESWDWKTHKEATEACKAKNGFLAELLDQDQQDALIQFIAEEYPESDASPHSTGDWWVGGKNYNGAFSWDVSQSQVKGDWQIGEPWGNGDCLLLGRKSGKYYGYHCNYAMRYACEWIPDSVCLGRNCTNNSVCVPLKFNEGKCVCPRGWSGTPETGCINDGNSNTSVQYSANAILIILVFTFVSVFYNLD